MLRYLVLMTLATGGAAAQQTLSLNRPDAEYGEPFTAIAGLRELPSGKVLVTDRTDKVLQLIDLTAGTATKVGREGKGPEEYDTPVALFALPDGSTLLQDLGNFRFLTILPDGKVGKILTVPSPPANGNGGGGPRFQLAGGVGTIIGIRGVDVRGHLYFSSPSFSPDGTSQDSAPILRWDRVKPTFDTVTWIPVPENQRPVVARSGSGNQSSVRVTMGSRGAWPKNNAWVPDPAGRIAVVTPEPYQVTWFSGKNHTTGPAVRYQGPKVTDADKKAWIDRQSRIRPTVMTFGGGGGGGARPNIGVPAFDPTTIEWPETLPAFTGPTSALVTPEGHVWVPRVMPASQKNPRYDIFDGQGRLIGDATLRPNSRVVGFGKGTVYVARSDEDDLQYLERHRR